MTRRRASWTSGDTGKFFLISSQRLIISHRVSARSREVQTGLILTHVENVPYTMFMSSQWKTRRGSRPEDDKESHKQSGEGNPPWET